MKKTRPEELFEQIKKAAREPFVTARFGEHWKKYAKENMDLDTVIDIAWFNGRRAELLERALVKLLKANPNVTIQLNKQEPITNYQLPTTKH